MAVFCLKAFRRFAVKAGLRNRSLLQAARDIMAGRAHADLGGGLVKHRLGRPGEGKSGGYRTIVVFRKGTHLFFVHGFAKSDKGNITLREHAALQKLSGVLLGLDGAALSRAVVAGEVIEVREDDGEQEAKS